jgi:hypothetical protein
MFNKFKDLITTQPDVMEALLADPFDFEPNAVGYHPNNAYFLARLAYLTYLDEETIKKKVPKLHSEFKIHIITPDPTWVTFKDIYSGISIRDTEAIVLENDKSVIVAFRGTQKISIVDWITDAHCRHSTKGCGGYGVHHGIYEALMSVWNQIEPYIKNKGEKTLWFTGHSLGGALAALATANCLFDPNKVTPNGLYTYGQPKVGGEDFAIAFNKEFKNQAFRFVNNNDIVPLLPPSLSNLYVQLPNLLNYLPKFSVEPINVHTAFEYYDIGHLKFFDKNATLQNESFGFADRAPDLIAGYLESALKLGPGSLTLGGIFDRVDGVSDHSMAKYVANLKQHREEWVTNNPKTSS